MKTKTFVYGGVILASALLASSLQAQGADLDKLRRNAALVDMSLLSAAIDVYRIDCGVFPTDKQGFDALVNDPGVKGWKGPYLAGKPPVDPWKTPYRYQQVKDEYQLSSAGKDKKFDTADDVKPEKPQKNRPAGG